MRHTRFRFALAGLLFACAAGAQDKLPKAKDFDAPPPAPGAKGELRRALTGRTPEQQLAVLEHLAAQWDAHKGTCAAARLAFAARVAELSDAEGRLAETAPPAAFAGPVRAPADLDAATAAATARAEFFAPRVKELEALATRAAEAGALRADVARAGDAAATHLELVRFARDLAKLPADKLPALTKPAGLQEAEALIEAFRKETATRAAALYALARAMEAQLAGARSALAAETAARAELKATREATLAALAFEASLKEMAAGPLADELGRARAALAEKRGALAGDAADYAKAASAAAEARARRAAVADPQVPLGQNDLPGAYAFLTAQLRAGDDRAERGTALVAALDEQEKRGLAYAATLTDARRAATRLAASASELGARAGRGELKPDQVPGAFARAAAEVAEASEFAASAAALQKGLADLRAEREALRKPDPESEAARALTAAARAKVAERLELQAEAQRFASEHAVEPKGRAPAEQKRVERRAAEFRARDRDPAEPLLELDRSPLAADRAALLDAYYLELADLAERQDALAAQQERLAKLAELPRKEADDLAKLRAVLDKRPGPWDAWLAARLAPSGLAAEASAYLDERARLDAVAAARAGRVAALTGNAPTANSVEHARLPATGGALGDARRELNEARARGLAVLGIKLAAVFAGALLASVLLARALKRALRGANPSPVLGPVRRAVRWLVWFSALAVALNVLGFDVTAGVVGAAIGLLALALAARSVIADALAAVAICADGRFQVGDVVRLSGGEPARVVSLTWRSTALKNASGLTVSVPNRKITEAPIENLSRGAETYDALTVTVSTDKDAGKVIGVIRGALAQCKGLASEPSVSVLNYAHKGPVKVVTYRFSWYLKDFDTRNKTRDEVFARIALGLASEDMNGIEVSLT
jgi:small-conductance mechanosensitive channel